LSVNFALCIYANSDIWIVNCYVIIYFILCSYYRWFDELKINLKIDQIVKFDIWDEFFVTKN